MHQAAPRKFVVNVVEVVHLLVLVDKKYGDAVKHPHQVVEKPPIAALLQKVQTLVYF
jgi:hypothetical protein